MKSFLFCTMYIQESRRDLDARRLEQWLEYYLPRKDTLVITNIFLIDDGSSLDEVYKLKYKLLVFNADLPLPEKLPGNEEIVVFRFSNHLGRISNEKFPGWRRSFSFSSQIAHKYSFEKIIHCESDAIICRARMFRYINSLNRGWTTFWVPFYSFPETAIQVICKDSISQLEHLFKDQAWFYSDVLTEYILPFSSVDKGFIGDRYGEYRASYPVYADYVCQKKLQMKRSIIPSSFMRVYWERAFLKRRAFLIKITQQYLSNFFKTMK